MRLKLALVVRETVAGHRLGALEGGVGACLPPFRCIPARPSRAPQWVRMSKWWKTLLRTVDTAVADRDVLKLGAIVERTVTEQTPRLPPKHILRVMEVLGDEGRTGPTVQLYRHVRYPPAIAAGEAAEIDDRAFAEYYEAALHHVRLGDPKFAEPFYGHLFRAFANSTALDLDKLLEVIEEDRRVPWRTPLYNCAFQCCRRNGRMDVAWGLFARMQKACARDRPRARACRPDSETYRTLLLGLAEADMWPECEAAVAALEADAWVVYDTFLYNAVLEALLPRRDVGFALRWYSDMAERGLRPVVRTFDLLFRYCHERGDYSAASYLFGQCVEHRVKPPEHVLRSMAAALREAEAWEDLPVLAREMVRRGVEPDGDLARLLGPKRGRASDAN